MVAQRPASPASFWAVGCTLILDGAKMSRQRTDELELILCRLRVPDGMHDPVPYTVEFL